MAMSSVVFATIFTEHHFYTLPFLRANMEQVGSWFKRFDIVAGVPANETLVDQMSQDGDQRLAGLQFDGTGRWRNLDDLDAVEHAAESAGVRPNSESQIMAMYLHSWRSDAARGRYARPLSRETAVPTPYRLELVLNETAYADCSRFPVGRLHRRRICRIGRARNAVMERLERPQFANTDFLILVDADVCARWDHGSFAIALATPPPWAMVGANGVGRMLPSNSDAFIYVDTLAWLGLPNTTIGMHSLTGKGMHNSNPSYAVRHFDFDGPPISVESAFGGVAIYRYSSVTGCRYGVGNSDTRTQNAISAVYACEHHQFHHCVRGRLLMHPGFVIEWEGSDTTSRSRCVHTWRKPEPSYVSTDSVAQALKIHLALRRTEFMVWPPHPPLPQYFLPPAPGADAEHLAKRKEAWALKKKLRAKELRKEEQARVALKRIRERSRAKSKSAKSASNG